MRYPAPIFHPLQRGQKCSILGGQLVVVMFPAVQDPYITRNRSLGRIVESKAFFHGTPRLSRAWWFVKILKDTSPGLLMVRFIDGRGVVGWLGAGVLVLFRGVSGLRLW